MYHYIYIYIIVIPGCKGCFVFEWTPGCHFQHQAERCAAGRAQADQRAATQLPSSQQPGRMGGPCCFDKVGAFSLNLRS